jgi:MFS transporter, AAHS family, 4-hydroxybenzoate transporter
MNSRTNSVELAAERASAEVQRLSRFQVRVFLLCAFVALMDGFDTQAIALAAPDIASDWNAPPVAFAGVFASGLLGALFGALIFGVGADRFGRKPSLLAAIVLFSLAALVTPYTATLQELTAVRFVTGIGLGGALPGVIAVTSEFAPRQRRASIVSLMFCGFPLGAVVGGVIAALLIPSFGWKALFYIGAFVPLLLLPVFVALVPESIRFLQLRGKHEQARAILRKMSLSEAAIDHIRPADAQGRHRKLKVLSGLFGEGRALGTLILTVTFLLSLLLSYFLVNWLPLLARQAGAGLESAVLGVAALNLGAIGGCLSIGRLMNRHGPLRPIAVAYAMGAAVIALIGFSAHSGVLLLCMCFLTGAFSIGAQMCVVGLGATFYETSVRATGVGWLLGTGRIGAILGPIFGGMLLAREVAIANLFLIAGAVSLAAALGVFLLEQSGFRRYT